MIVAVVVISLVIGFVVAAGVVGSQAQRLGRQRREPVWRLAEAAQFVSDLLPFDVAAGLGPSELETLLRAHLNQLQFASDTMHDLAASQTAASADTARLMAVPEGAASDTAAAASAASASPVSEGAAEAVDSAPASVATTGISVTEDRSSIAELYRGLRRDGIEVSLEQVHAVAAAHLEYLRRIGALAAAEPDGGRACDEDG
ncbi:hypothetical protein [Candidatus Poriferisodalis sp.]|uniref:hypothetical protein n=1 Tax=Candidatus Poriferisodalis sp. TaxID=3101277 RepID=UPI003B023CA3